VAPLKWLEFTDLVSAAVIGLAAAVKNFSPDRGVRLASYAYTNITGVIRDELEKAALIRMPREAALLDNLRDAYAGTRRTDHLRRGAARTREADHDPCGLRPLDSQEGTKGGLTGWLRFRRAGTSTNRPRGPRVRATPCETRLCRYPEERPLVAFW